MIVLRDRNLATRSFTFTPRHSHSHLISRTTGRPARWFGDQTRFRPRSQSRKTIIHIHTSPFTFTPHQPNHRATARWFGDHTRLGPRLQSRSMIIHIHTSTT